jgi:hypothetical protein
MLELEKYRGGNQNRMKTEKDGDDDWKKGG